MCFSQTLIANILSVKYKMSNSSLFNKILYLKKKPSTVIKKISYIINYSFHSSFKHTIKNQFPEVLNAAS